MNYLNAVCDINLFKAIISTCVTIIIATFGEDHTAVVVATLLFFLDTITGTFYACVQGSCSSRGFYPAVKKGFVISTSFVSLALLALLHPELSYLLIAFPSLVAVNEFGSILENVHKIHPNPITEYILTTFGVLKDGILNQITKKK
jgi:phage-related holin